MIDTSGSEKNLYPCFVLFCVMEQAYSFFFARGSFVIRLHEYAKSGSVQLPECNLLENERLEKLVSVRLTSERKNALNLISVVGLTSGDGGLFCPP